MREAFATPRRSEIVAWDSDVEDEDLIQREDMVVTVSHAGYIKRVPLSTYRAQRRGGKGRSGMQTREEDFVTRLFVANTHTPVLFFSSLGQVYKEKVWRLPLAAPNAKGRFLSGMLPLEEGERITTIMPLPEDEASWDRLDVMFATRSGSVRRNKLSDFVQVNRAGKIAMKLDEGDEIVDVQICSEADDVLLTTAKGQCIRFPITRTCASSRAGTRPACAASSSAKATASSRWRSCAISRRGRRSGAVLRRASAMRRALGRAGRTSRAKVETTEAEEAGGPGGRARGAIRPDGRGRAVRADGVRAGLRQALLVLRVPDLGTRRQGHRRQAVNERIGPLVASFPVENLDEIMLVTDGGKLIRVPVDGIRIVSRASKGVTVFNTDGERVVSVEHIEGEEARAEKGAGRGPERPLGSAPARAHPVMRAPGPFHCLMPRFSQPWAVWLRLTLPELVKLLRTSLVQIGLLLLGLPWIFRSAFGR